MWMMLLHLHVNLNADNDDDNDFLMVNSLNCIDCVKNAN